MPFIIYRVFNLILKHTVWVLYDEPIYSLMSIMSTLISVSTNNSWGRWEAGSHSGSVYELLVAHSVPPIHTGFCSIILAGYWWGKCRWPEDYSNQKNACHPSLSGALWEARQHPSHHSPLQTCKGLPQGRGSNWAPPEKIWYLLQ